MSGDVRDAHQTVTPHLFFSPADSFNWLCLVEEGPETTVPCGLVYSFVGVFFLRILFFLMQIFFKAFIEFVTTQLLFYVSVFWLRGTCGILALQPGIGLSPPPRIGR